MFLIKYSKASGDFSIAQILEFLKYFLRQIAIAPEPEHKSIIFPEKFLLKFLHIYSTNNSVSGLGIKTPEPTFNFIPKKSVCFKIYCIGSPFFIRLKYSKKIFFLFLSIFKSGF